MTTTPNRLQEPTLELTDANGNVTFNDDWRDDQEAAINATTIPPSDDREAAIRATLSAGPYTAIVRGKENTTGVALVEIYSLQSSRVFRRMKRMQKTRTIPMMASDREIQSAIASFHQR